MANPLQGLGFQAGLNRDTLAEQKAQLGQAGELAKQKKGGLLGSLLGSQLGKFAVDKLLGTYLKTQFGPMGVLMGKALGAGLGAWGGTKLGVGRKKDVGAKYGAGTGLLGSGYERLGKLQDSISGMAKSQGVGAGLGTFVSGLGSEALQKAKHLDPSVSADSLRPDLDYNFDETGKGMRELKGYDTNIMSDFDADYSDAFEMTGAGDMVGLEFPDYDTFSLPSAPSLQEKTLKNLGIMQNIDLGGSPAGGALESAKQGLFDYEGYIPDELLPSFTGPRRTALGQSTSKTLFGQQGGSVGGLLGLQMGGMPGTSNPIPYQNGGEAGLQYAEDYEYSPSGFEKILDTLPFIGGKRAYDRAEKYRKNVHWNPEDIEFRRAQDRRGMDVFGSGSRLQHEEDDITKGNKFQHRALTISQEDPRSFTYRNMAEDDDLSTVDQFIIGSQSGHIMETDNTQDYVVDPYNIAKSSKNYEGILGMLGIPRYSGSVKKNPGIEAYIDPAYLKEQVMQTDARRLAGGGYLRQYNLGGSVAQQPMSYQIGGLLKYKRNPMVG